ncbi:MAG: hypothetical protein U0871_13635 [Gemmataceae bacterium]
MNSSTTQLSAQAERDPPPMWRPGPQPHNRIGSNFVEHLLLQIVDALCPDGQLVAVPVRVRQLTVVIIPDVLPGGEV